MTRERIASGCLFGLAYGDALGAPTEFLNVAQIHARFGPTGPQELSGDPALVTDDTQMTIAVGRALLDVPDPRPDTLAPVLRQRFIAWANSEDNNRGPGRTCLSACANLAKGMPWQQATIIESKGCGANMRVAPVGLNRAYPLEIVAGVAQMQAALTHGHPTALAASDLTAYAVRMLATGADLGELPALLRQRCHAQHAIYHHDWLGELWRRGQADSPADFIGRGWAECLAALDRLDDALSAADTGDDPCPLTGEGWIAEEALATAVFCAVRHATDPVAALSRAATTAGDSDSLACVTGALVGAGLGMSAWPDGWAIRIEYADELTALASAWD